MNAWDIFTALVVATLITFAIIDPSWLMSITNGVIGGLVYAAWYASNRTGGD